MFMLIIIKKGFFIIYILFFLFDNPGCLPAALRLRSRARPWGLLPAAIIWWCSPRLYHRPSIVIKLQGYCDSATTKFTMLMINKRVYNHPSKRFTRESFQEVATRKSIRGATNG